jgi:uncharacterized protein (TIGR02231 family)
MILILSGIGLLALLVWAANGLPAKSPLDQEAAPAAKEANPAAPAAGVKLAQSRLVAVTVYPNSALVTREVDVPEGPGTIELTVTPLPPATVNGSLYTEGTDGIRVLATRFRTRAVLEDTREDVRKLLDELKQLQLQQEKVEGDIKAAQANLLFLSKLESFTTATAGHAAEKGAPSGENAIALAKYLMEGRGDKYKEQVTLQQQAKAIEDKIEFARRKLSELAWNPNRTERDAVIVVEKANGGAGTVRLSYLVDEAEWHPQYKLRAGKAAKDPVRLEYLAAIVQHTGEDWNNVRLVLSTAQPTLNAAPPDLQVLQVAVVPRANLAPNIAASVPDPELQDQVRNLRTKAQKDINQRKQATGVGLINTAAALDQSWELLNPEAAVRRGCALTVREGPSVTYHLDSRLTVPSRTDEQTLEVARLDLPPEYYYKAVPILTQHVYRLADLSNKSNYVLLPGEATLYVGTDFVGQMNLPLVAIGEQFTAGFGVDPQLQVQRQMIDRAKAIQGGNQVLRYDYQILLSSYKAERVKLQVWDRLPHTEADTVGVSLLKATPEVSSDPLYVREQRPNNLLRWDLNIDPGMNGEKALAIRYEFKLELDRQMAIASFQSTGVAKAETPPAGVTPLPALTADEMTKVRASLAKLTPEDRSLAEAQVWCAIDQESPLGINGPPFKMMIKNRPVFVCCKGCQAEAKAHPDKALTMLDQLMARLKAGQAKTEAPVGRGR